LVSMSFMRVCPVYAFFFFFSSRRRHTRSKRDWSSDVCSSDLAKSSVVFSVRGLSCADFLSVDKSVLILACSFLCCSFILNPLSNTVITYHNCIHLTSIYFLYLFHNETHFCSHIC